jgi:hypothetical protein
MLRGTLIVPADQELDDLIDFKWRQGPTITRRNADGTADFQIRWSYEGSENVAEGDLEDDIAPIFPELLELKKFHGATFELQIVVGSPHPDLFRIAPHIVAMIAALGGTISATHEEPPLDNDQ